MARSTPVPTAPYPTRPEPGVKWVWFIRGIFLPLLYLLPFLLPFGFSLVSITSKSSSGSFPWDVVILWACLIYGGLVLLILIWAVLAVDRYTFEVGPEEVVVRKGVLFRTETHIPLRRVQDIVVRQGPLLRMFGLGTIKLQTAGIVSNNRYSGMLIGQGDIPGIRDAGAVATRLLAQVKALKGDV